MRRVNLTEVVRGGAAGLKREIGLARKIHVVGTSGSGKTAFASRLAGRLNIAHAELDSLFWGPNWSGTPDNEFRRKVGAVVQGPEWVIDGNYTRVRDLIWPRAEVVIWLDYRLCVILFRVTRRTLWRIFTREMLWHGNRESVRASLLSKESIILWSLRTYRRRKREYAGLAQQAGNDHLRVLRLRTVRQARELLENPTRYLGAVEP